jgi:hypothetical protein
VSWEGQKCPCQHDCQQNIVSATPSVAVAVPQTGLGGEPPPRPRVEVPLWRLLWRLKLANITFSSGGRIPELSGIIGLRTRMVSGSNGPAVTDARASEMPRLFLRNCFGQNPPDSGGRLFTRTKAVQFLPEYDTLYPQTGYAGSKAGRRY